MRKNNAVRLLQRQIVLEGNTETLAGIVRVISEVYSRDVEIRYVRESA